MEKKKGGLKVVFTVEELFSQESLMPLFEFFDMPFPAKLSNRISDLVVGIESAIKKYNTILSDLRKKHGKPDENGNYNVTTPGSKAWLGAEDQVEAYNAWKVEADKLRAIEEEFDSPEIGLSELGNMPIKPSILAFLKTKNIVK